MPPKNVKFPKPKSAPIKVPHQPPIYEAPPEPEEEALPVFEPKPKVVIAKPKAVEFKPLPKPTQPASFDSTKISNSMWFHVALIAVALLGFVVLFLKINTDTQRIQADIGRLEIDLQTVQLQVKSTNDKVIKLQEAVAELSSGIAAPAVASPTETPSE